MLTLDPEQPFSGKEPNMEIRKLRSQVSQLVEFNFRTIKYEKGHVYSCGFHSEKINKEKERPYNYHC